MKSIISFFLQFWWYKFLTLKQMSLGSIFFLLNAIKRMQHAPYYLQFQIDEKIGDQHTNVHVKILVTEVNLPNNFFE